MLRALALSALVVSGFAQKPGSDTYSQVAANHTLMFAYGAYCPIEQLRSWTCKWCKEAPGVVIDTVYENGDLLAFTGWDARRGQIVVSFRGTSNPGNWITDLDTFQVDYPPVAGGRIHQGFYRAWRNILQPVILPSTQSLMDRHFGSRILVTGHSMGAAIAQIASLDIFKYATLTKNPAYRRVEDFGSPRWCNEALSNYFTASCDVHWRVVNVHDVVPKVPWLPGFQHTSREVWYTSKNPLQYRICADVHDDKDCSYWQASVDDHLTYMGIHTGCV